MSGVVSFLLKVGSPIIGSLLFEEYVLRSNVESLYKVVKGTSIPKSYGMVILVNVVGSTIVLLVLGFKVSAARTNCKTKAIEAGDKDAEERYSYPKMYAEGFDSNAHQFNCVQRAHQHALETYPQVLSMALIGGLRFPVSCTLAGIYWNLARLKYAEGYSTGDPKRRYRHWSSYGIWTALLWQMAAASATGLALLISRSD